MIKTLFIILALFIGIAANAQIPVPPTDAPLKSTSTYSKVPCGEETIDLGGLTPILEGGDTVGYTHTSSSGKLDTFPVSKVTAVDGTSINADGEIILGYNDANVPQLNKFQADKWQDIQNFHYQFKGASDDDLLKIDGSNALTGTGKGTALDGNVSIGNSVGTYKLNILGRIDLDNGASSVVLGNNDAGLNIDNFNQIVIGSAAMTNTASLGSSRIAIGNGAGKNAQGGASISIGANSTENIVNIGGNSVIAIGDNTLRNYATTSSNLAIGFNVMQSTAGGGQNVVVGNASLSATTLINASENVAIGESIMRLYTSGDARFNTMVGKEVSLAGNSHWRNTFIGYQVASEMRNAEYNSITGSQAIARGQNAYYNSLNGYRTLYCNATTGQFFRNTSNGYQSGARRLTLTDNVLIGHEAGLGEQTNEASSLTRVTAIGANTQRNLTAASVTDVLALGYGAGDGNTQSNRWIISTNALPKFANPTVANLTLPLPGVGGTYLYHDTDADVIRVRSANNRVLVVVQGIYNNHADAIANGLAIGDVYEASSANTYGIPEGTHLTVR